MTAWITPRRSPGVAWYVLAAALLVVVCSVGGDALAGPLLLVGLLLVPVGLVYGIVARVLLTVRRRRARGRRGPLDAIGALAAAGRAPVQVAARRLDAVLLGMAVVGTAVVLTSGWLDTARYGFGDQAPAELVLDALAHLTFGLLVTAMLAIPAALAVLTWQLRESAVQAGEARALLSGGPPARRILADRALSILVTGLYLALAAAAVIQVVTFTPSF